MQKTPRKVIAASITYLVVSCALLSGLVLACKRPTPPAVEKPNSVAYASAPDELRRHLRVICLGGVEYYYAKWYTVDVGYSVLAPKFTADNTTNTVHPARCRAEDP